MSYHGKTVSRADALALVDKATQGIEVWTDKQFRWWKTGDSQQSCPLLDAAIAMEYRSGTIIFIPDEVNEAGKFPRNG